MKKYSFIIWNRSFSIRNERELEVLLKLYSKSQLSSIIHWNILMELDLDLENIIVSFKWLSKCIKHLNEKNTFLLFVKLADKLPEIITNSKHLWELLVTIPEDENKLKLLKMYRKINLEKIIKNAKDLWNIVEWIYWKEQLLTLEYLWKDFIKNVFMKTNEIIMILHYLNPANKDYLTELIWIRNMRMKVKTSKDFLLMFCWLSDENAKNFIKLFSKEQILDMFKTEYDFYNFMLKLPIKKEKIFLKFFKIWQ